MMKSSKCCLCLMLILPDALALCLLQQGYLRDSRSPQHLHGALLSCVLEQWAGIVVQCHSREGGLGLGLGVHSILHHTCVWCLNRAQCLKAC